MVVLHDWLKDFLGDNTPSVTDIESLLTFHAFEIEETKVVHGKDVIDVKILPDRSADCLSHRGIARELATLTGKPLAHDPFVAPRALEPKTPKITVTIEDPQRCRRFGVALVTGVTVKESPVWLRERLEALGQRSINNVVDATNYVMLSLGQPLHAYDGDLFSTQDGVWQFSVRRAHEGERITTLTNDEYTLAPAVQLIVDAGNGALAGIAGIKGGKYAEVTGTTTTILLEAANFDPSFTRKASQFLKLQTDASKRFENNISRQVVPFALTEAVALIRDIAGGTCEGYVDAYPSPEENPEVTVTLTQTNALLGLLLTHEEIETIMARLGFTHRREGDMWHVVAPFERRDILIAEDIIADIGRVYGYEHVSSVVPTPIPLTEVNARQYYSDRVRDLLVEEGFSEVITSSFRKKDEIRLANALAEDKAYLRSMLSQNIREVLDKNMPYADLLGTTRVQVFEIGTVFKKLPEDSGIDEKVMLALGVRTKQTGYTPTDDARLEALKTKLETTLGESLHAHINKGVLECDLTSLIARLPKPSAYEPFVPPRDVTYERHAHYPFVSRDIALWVPEAVSPESVCEIIETTAGPLLVRTTLFDAFKKDGKTSYAFRLVFQSHERTLTDGEVGTTMEAVTNALENAGYTVR